LGENTPKVEHFNVNTSLEVLTIISNKGALEDALLERLWLASLIVAGVTLNIGGVARCSSNTKIDSCRFWTSRTVHVC